MAGLHKALVEDSAACQLSSLQTFQLADAKVGDLHNAPPSTVKENVRWLEIAVNNVAL